METIKPEQNQNIFDISLQEYGTIEMVFDLLDDNDITEVTQELSVYDDLKIIREPLQRDIAAFYLSRGIRPATRENDRDLELIRINTKSVGVGFMQIGKDFMVKDEDDQNEGTPGV